MLVFIVAAILVIILCVAAYLYYNANRSECPCAPNFACVAKKCVARTRGCPCDPGYKCVNNACVLNAVDTNKLQPKISALCDAIDQKNAALTIYMTAIKPAYDIVMGFIKSFGFNETTTLPITTAQLPAIFANVSFAPPILTKLLTYMHSVYFAVINAQSAMFRAKKIVGAITQSTNLSIVTTVQQQLITTLTAPDLHGTYPDLGTFGTYIMNTPSIYTLHRMILSGKPMNDPLTTGITITKTVATATPILNHVHQMCTNATFTDFTAIINAMSDFVAYSRTILV